MFDPTDPALREDEVFPDVHILQYREGFSYGTDAVLLADFIRVNKKNPVGVEFGTGTGIIPILLSKKMNYASLTAFEIQEDYALLARENLRRTSLSDRVQVVWDDLKNAAAHVKGEVDFVFTNPPYMKMTSGFLNEGERKLIARHEKFCTLEEICRSAAGLLKYGGSFFCVHRPDRLVDLFCALRAADLEPKELVTVHSYAGEAPKLILCRARKCAAPSLIVAKPLVLYPDKKETL